MKKIIRLTESDLIRLVKRVISEQSDTTYKTKIYNYNRTKIKINEELTLKYLEDVDYQGTTLIKLDIIDWEGKVLYFDCESGFSYLKNSDEQECTCSTYGQTRLEQKVEDEIRSKYCPAAI
jgi:hypothetical protein